MLKSINIVVFSSISIRRRRKPTITSINLTHNNYFVFNRGGLADFTMAGIVSNKPIEK